MLNKERGTQGIFSLIGLKIASCSKRLVRSAIVLGLFAGSSSLFAQSISLAWDTSTSANVIAYRVYYGNVSGSYSHATNVGNKISATIGGLQVGANYFFAVTAVDNVGLESLPSNEVTYQVPATITTAPTIALTSPGNGAGYTAPAAINLAASVTANGHTITKVQFYNGATLLGEDASAPYSFTWSNVGAGSYNLKATVVYDAGSNLSSTSVNVMVVNPPPTIALTSPVSGANYTAPATINCAASVSANGNAITSVQFFNGTTLVGTDTSAPYSFTMSNVSAGSYTLSARAVYGNGSTVVSSPASITVTGSPAPWQSMDIGAVGMPGSFSQSNGIYTVTGSGTLVGTADSFHFVYQSLSADGEIRGQLSSVGTSGLNGVMIRENLTAGSPYAFMGVQPNGKFHWQERSSTSGSATSKTTGKGNPPNVWIRLVRAGNTVSFYRSTDGNNWTLAHSRNIPMAVNVYVGLAVSSGSSHMLNTSAFTSVMVTP